MTVTYDEGLVRDLLRDQHPDLAGLPLREVDGGWDNQLWRLGDDLAVRLPRTNRAPDLIRQEQRWLPGLAPLPLPVPVPVRTGEPSALLDRPWTIARWIDGEPADREPVTNPASAETLARFLRALHQPAPEDAPANPSRGISLEALDAQTTGMFDLIPGHPATEALRQVWQDALAASPWDGPSLWLHGDLHPANVVTRAGALCGVLDFGDMCAGDPATDLSAAWLLLPEPARFFEAYACDPASITRARGWAVARAIGLVMIGRNGRLGVPGGKPTWEPAGQAALERLAAS